MINFDIFYSFQSFSCYISYSMKWIKTVNKISLFKLMLKFVEPGMVVHTFNHRTWQAQVGWTPWVRGKPDLHANTLANQRYVARTCLDGAKK